MRCRGSAKICRTICSCEPIFGVTGARTLNVDYQSLLRRGLMGLDYGFRRRGPLTMAPSQLGLFARSSPDYATANIEFHVQPLSLDRFGEPMHAYPAITISVCNLRPESRGFSLTPQVPIRSWRLLFNQTICRLSPTSGLRWTPFVLRAASPQLPALARYAPLELKPGANLQSDDELPASGRRKSVPRSSTR